MVGWLAISRSGHDKGRVYAIVGEGETDVLLADGKARTVGHPKRKNKKHVQVIRKLPQEVAALLPEGGTFRDEEIKRAIKVYMHEQEV